MGHNQEVPIMPEEHGPVDPVPNPVPDPATDPASPDPGVRMPSDPVDDDDDDPLFQQMLDDRARNEAALADAELELLAQADQLQEELVMDEAGRELLAQAAAAGHPPPDWAADPDRAADLVNAFLDAHGTAMVLDLMAGLLADPKWSRAWREFVASRGRAA
jgi:hypothetical protein